MNFRFVFSQLGLLFLVLSIIMLLIAGWSSIQWRLGDDDEAVAGAALLFCALIGAVAGGGLWRLTRGPAAQLGRREALLLVAMGWLVGAALAAAPFLVWAHLGGEPTGAHPFRNPVNCYFEAMSGLTTTGATVLTNIRTMPSSLLLWRATTHWLGGLGIVVLFVAVLPSLGVGGKKLFRVETPGPEPEGVHPHIRETARILWMIYLGLTVTEIIALRIAGMDWFESVCHTFATLATGGFSTQDASVGGFGSSAIHIIVIVFMILAGVNFGLYYAIIRGRFGSVWRDAELRTYLALILVASAVVVFSIWNRAIDLTTGEQVSASAGIAIREGVFTTVSMQTTTGFCTSDFDGWPFMAKAALVLLMFVGGSAGSTGGGIKVIRVVIAFKVMWSEIERVFRPNVVRMVKVGSATITPELKLATASYILTICVLLAIGAGSLMLLEPAGEIDITTAATASIATLFNIGPGLAKVGAVQNYAWFTDQSKLVMILLMALGRLEVFAILVLFFPRFWRGN